MLTQEQEREAEEIAAGVMGHFGLPPQFAESTRRGARLGLERWNEIRAETDAEWAALSPAHRAWVRLWRAVKGVANKMLGEWR